MTSEMMFEVDFLGWGASGFWGLEVGVLEFGSLVRAVADWLSMGEGFWDKFHVFDVFELEF